MTVAHTALVTRQATHLDSYSPPALTTDSVESITVQAGDKIGRGEILTEPIPIVSGGEEGYICERLHHLATAGPPFDSCQKRNSELVRNERARSVNRLPRSDSHPRDTSPVVSGRGMGPASALVRLCGISLKDASRLVAGSKLKRIDNAVEEDWSSGSDSDSDY
ncbi:hypothetical protein CYMTET_25425 [Cymbomonas tetramitiformis]|uniref:Uncharacterized protein n=1 Tax=Cymbomonas tetramitiformis TaxID=36881 RepID=A0AAE0KYX8_9CHLO|nr:hypothetical protein CYMTET_25425 [Cymbomonas tetramitiformis]